MDFSQANAGTGENDYLIRFWKRLVDIPAKAWDSLLAASDAPTPFMKHAYLAALENSGSAVPETGWSPAFITLQAHGDTGAPPCFLAAAPFYIKAHSRGEYVFDWAWARAYEQHGLAYYPKGLVAVPFTPVPGSRLLARSTAWRQMLIRELVKSCTAQQLSSLHVLFESHDDLRACEASHLLERQDVQFHWHQPTPPVPDFQAYLATLTHDKRKKIRQEQRRVTEAGVRFTAHRGNAITPEDWDYFYLCYQVTYAEHGNPPYLTRTFFKAMAENLAEHWVMFTAWQDLPAGAQRVGCSLVAIDEMTGHAWGRYWGATQRIDCLHFCACYYEPIAWCIANGFHVFEGGAQGEHKLARGFMPKTTHSTHWLAEPAFAAAVEHYLERESGAIEQYVDVLQAHAPFRRKEGTD